MMKTEKGIRWIIGDKFDVFILHYSVKYISGCYLLESSHQSSSNVYPQDVLLRNIATYVFKLIYRQLPFLSTCLEQIQKITTIDSIYLSIYLSIENET